MSDRIKLLADSVANQIAAGEVVNRPASVVKELMENAVDAGAGSVTVNFRDGGRELIQIKDDGCGMSPQDARMAFERHATSKISSVDDIYDLMTFGFRGEALASIAAVAQVEMLTRPESQELGTRLNIDGGVFAGQSAAAAPKGTQIWIRNLFYNVPARKKFLDKGSTEAAHIITEFQRVALAHPEVAFHLYRDDSPVYNLPAGRTGMVNGAEANGPAGGTDASGETGRTYANGEGVTGSGSGETVGGGTLAGSGALHQRVVGIAGKNAARNLLEVSVTTSIIRVGGFIGRPSSALRRNKDQFLFVNGRFFKSPFFHKAIVQAYDKLIPSTVQPSYFIYLDIDPENIDVNVHPQKTEVKFTDQSAVWQIIHAAARETLAKSGAVPMMDFDSEDRIEIPVLGGHAGLGPRYGYGGEQGEHSERRGVEGRDYLPPVREPAVVRSSDYNPFTKYGDNGHTYGDTPDPDADYDPPTYRPAQFDYISSAADDRATPNTLQGNPDNPDNLDPSITGINTAPGTFSAVTNIGEGYATALYGEIFVVIDLRRAREAVMFDRIEAMLGSGRTATQQLLFPERMVFSADDAQLMKDHGEEFAAFGFDIRRAGEHSVDIFGTPADMSSEALDEVIYGMLDELRDGTFTGTEARRRKLAAVMARSASSAGALRLSPGETGIVLAALASARNPSFTPGGKPVMAEITIDEIKNKLK